jgi:hypothetical protein
MSACAVTAPKQAIFVATAFAILWIGFMRAVQGPVAGAKYRLHMEPFAMMLVGAADARLCGEARRYAA